MFVLELLIMDPDSDNKNGELENRVNGRVLYENVTKY